jgi:hypothetical protein
MSYSGIAFVHFEIHHQQGRTKGYSLTHLDLQAPNKINKGWAMNFVSNWVVRKVGLIMKYIPMNVKLQTKYSFYF